MDQISIIQVINTINISLLWCKICDQLYVGTVQNGFRRRWHTYVYQLNNLSISTCKNVLHIHKCGVDNIYVTLIASMETPAQMYWKEEEIIGFLVESGAKLTNTCKSSVEMRDTQSRVHMLRREQELVSPQETREAMAAERRRLLVREKCEGL